MKLPTFLLLQVFFIAFLCPSALTFGGPPTLDGLIKDLGSLYQKKLFSIRDDFDVIENLKSQLNRDNSDGPEVYETVTVPRYHYCLKTIPYCVTFYASIIVQDKGKLEVEPVNMNIRKSHEKTCFTNINLGPCPKEIGSDSFEQGVIDVSNVEINSFCTPGLVELNGTLDVLTDIKSDTYIYLELDEWPVISNRRSFDYSNSSRCLNGGVFCKFYNLCDLLEDGNCKGRRNSYHPGIPCTCPIEPDTYDMNGFTKKFEEKVDFNYIKMRGFFIIIAGNAKSCASISFLLNQEGF